MMTKTVGASGSFPQTRQSLVGKLENWDDAGPWGEFARIYSPIILAMARNAGLRDTEAHEVLQAVLLGTAVNMQDEITQYMPERGRFRGWLINLVRWKIGEQFKKRQRWERDGNGGADDVLAALPDESACIAGAEVDRQWYDALLAAAVESVKAKVSLQQFQIFQLNVLKGMAAKDVCEQLGVSRMQVYLAKNRVGRLVQNEVRRLMKKTGAAEAQFVGRQP